MIKLSIVTAAFAIIGLSSSASAAEHIINGGFEGSSPFAGWVPFTGDGLVQAVAAPDVSPFSSSYGLSTASAKLVDGALFNSGPGLEQDFAPISGPTRFSFDFKLAALSDDYWFILPAFSPSPGNRQFITNIRLGDKGNFLLDSFGAKFTTTISADAWYHVNLDFNFSSQQLSGDITQFNGSTLGWAGIPFLQTISSLNALEIEDAAAQTAKNGDLFLDNISVREITPATPVPEASTFGLVAAAGLLVAAGARRYKRSR